MKVLTTFILATVPCFIMAATEHINQEPITLIGVLLANFNTLLGGLSTAIILWVVRKLEKKKMRAKHQRETEEIQENLNLAKLELEKRNIHLKNS